MTKKEKKLTKELARLRWEMQPYETNGEQLSYAELRTRYENQRINIFSLMVALDYAAVEIVTCYMELFDVS